MSAEYAELIKVCMGALWTVCLALGGYVLKSNSSKIDRMFDKIEELKDHREACVRSFADKESNHKQHTEIFSHLRDHDSRISVLEYAQKIKSE